MSFTTSRLRPRFEQVQQLRQSGQAAVAEMLAREILATVPGSTDDLYCQGGLLLQAGRFADALRRFDDAIRRGPALPELMCDRAVALLQLGRGEEALASAEAARAASPGFAPALLAAGDALRALDRPREALARYDQALGGRGDFIPALRNRAALLMALGRFEAALADLDRLLRHSPSEPELHNNRGLMLSELSRTGEALAAFDRALSLNPRHYKALHNRGAALWRLARFEEALASYDAALAIAPAAVTTISSRANTLQDLGRLEEAMAAHDRAAALAPDNASVHWNRAQGHLLQGRWKEGLAEYEWLHRRPQTAPSPFASPRWSGEDLQERTLLMRAEQGLGDTLQYCRYAALAAERGASVVLSVQRPLARLLREHLVPPVAAVLAEGEAAPAHDFQIEMSSLPFAFGTEVETAPARVPYLTADPARTARWAGRIGTKGFRIGICWQGAQPGGDMGRSFSPSLLAGIARLAGVRLVVLQKGAGLDQLAQLPPGMTVETLGEDFDAGPDAFLDSAAAMQSLDLVITSDTSIMHLAGALARPVWMAAKFVPEWRWLLKRSDSVWYPTARLFRQQAVGDWAGVFAGMEAALAPMLPR